MPVYDDGTRVKEAQWARLIESIPASYTVWKDGSTYRGESNLDGGTDYDGSDAATVIQAVFDDADCESVFFKETTYQTDTKLDLKDNLKLLFENPATELEASANIAALLDGEDHSQIYIQGGKLDGNGKATVVLDFNQTSATVTHNCVDRSIVCGARDTSDSCLIKLDGNSGFQLREPWLDGRVDAAGSTDSAEYGIILDSSGGQNTLYLGDINNFFQEACIRLGGGTLTVIGGALEGGNGSAVNIKVTSTSSGPALRVFGTWFESSSDNILITEGSYQPAYVDVQPSHMSAGGAGYGNVRATTTSNHLQHLRVRGGTWVNTGGTYNITAGTKVAETVWIDKVAFGQSIDTAKMDHYVVFHDAGWGHKFNDDLITTGQIQPAGVDSSSEIDIANNSGFRSRNQADDGWINIVKVNTSDETELELHEGKLIGADINDYITFDNTNNRWLFYIGGTCEGYIDSTGWHNGAP